jgi:hypothetical protein
MLFAMRTNKFPYNRVGLIADQARLQLSVFTLTFIPVKF